MFIPPDEINLQAVSTDPLFHPAFESVRITAFVLRLDKIHPLISGNKWFKLKYHLAEAVRQQKTQLLTFGGAYSNHLLATAALAHAAGLGSVGIVRGEAPALPSMTLQTAARLGMDLYFVSRSIYAAKAEPAEETAYRARFPEAWLIPEGGGGSPGIRGSMEMAAWILHRGYTHVIGAIGTGTGMEGIRRGMAGDPARIIGLPVLKTGDHPPDFPGITLFSGYHFGGYARTTPALTGFMNEIYGLNGIPLDFVYTAKLFYGVIDQAGKGYFPKGSRLLLIHSGGLQGNDSLPAQTLHF